MALNTGSGYLSESGALDGISDASSCENEND